MLKKICYKFILENFHPVSFQQQLTITFTSAMIHDAPPILQFAAREIHALASSGNRLSNANTHKTLRVTYEARIAGVPVSPPSQYTSNNTFPKLLALTARGNVGGGLKVAASTPPADQWRWRWNLIKRGVTPPIGRQCGENETKQWCR